MCSEIGNKILAGFYTLVVHGHFYFKDGCVNILGAKKRCTPIVVCKI
jgi:hypothetical protein